MEHLGGEILDVQRALTAWSGLAQAAAIEVGGRVDVDQIEDGRHDIDERRLVARALALGKGWRRAVDHRNVQCGVVHEQGVGLLAVFAAPFPMVRRDDHERAIPDAEGFEFLEQLADLCVRVGDLAAVEIVRVLRSEGLRREVGGVRIEEVGPVEKLSGLRVFVEPAEDDFVGEFGRPLAKHVG